MDNGGSFIWICNKGVEYHDQNAGEFSNPLFTDYFNVERCVQQGGLQYNIVGVTEHPVGRGIDVENTFIYSVAGDRSDSIWPKEGAEGHEHARESASSQRYKAIVQTARWASFGGSYWHYYNDASPQRIQAITQTMTWLGVPLRIAGVEDLAVESISSPLGKYVEPGADIPLDLIVKKTGHKDITSSFEVQFKVYDMDNGNSVEYQKIQSYSDGIDVGEVETTATLKDALANAFRVIGVSLTDKR